MLFDLPKFARRGAVIVAFAGIAGCDSSRSVEPFNLKSIGAPTAVAFSATGVGQSSVTLNSVPLTNPSFEIGLTGWAHGDVDDVAWQSSDGKFSIDLNGFTPGFVSQDISTIPGVTYSVSFDLAGNPGSPQGVKTMTVSAAGSSANYSFNTTGKSGTNLGWVPQSFSFTATSATTTLKFTSTYTGNGQFPDVAQGAAIDNVRVTWTATPTTTTVTFGSGPFVFNGSAFTATASVVPAEAGTPTITYSGDCINPGNTCTATAVTAANGQYAGSTATANITIQATSTTTVSFGPGPFVYNGSPFIATAMVSPEAAGTATIAYSGDCTNAGSTCTATATFAGNDAYASSSTTANITIDKAPTTSSATFGSGPFVYTGSAYSATASVSPAAAGVPSLSYSGDCVNAGSTCSATASFAGNGNYLPSSSNPASITINKAPTTTNVTFGTGPTVFYTGSAFTATASVTPGGAGSAAIAYSGQCVTAGTCTATATYAGNANFLSSAGTASVTIKYPVASTSDRCKNGGWQFLTDDLGNTFKNQGDCVSFVATKGKNKGAGGS